MTVFSDSGSRLDGPDDEGDDDETNEELEEAADEESQAAGGDEPESELEDDPIDDWFEELLDAPEDPATDDTTTENTTTAEAELEDVTETSAPEDAGVDHPVVGVPAAETSPFWSISQMMTVAQRGLAVFAVLGLIGYGLGSLRGASSIARAEFVYTLDESVPDSFLREDRRLLTQVVTFKSDAVLTPVAQQFDLDVDDLRAKIDVETLDLSEVLRLDVRDADEARAVAISRAVLDQYLQVIADATPAGDSEELARRRADITSQLAEADAASRALATARQEDVALDLQQQSLERQINLKDEQLNRLQASLDDSLVQRYPAATREALAEQLTDVELFLADLEKELADIGEQRAALATETTTEPALLREIERLESILTTIDDELAQRELGPLVASPIRELSEPIVLFRSRHIVGLQGMALGLMAALPLAALVAYRTRRRQLWFD